MSRRSLDHTVILIPAYEPGVELVSLLRAIRSRAPGQQLVVVDDGSGPDYWTVFNQASAIGADVIGHPLNMGKGYALRAGFAHIAAVYPGHDVVCADSDGQHRLDDIVEVADRLAELAATGSASSSHIVLGARQFVGDVPFRSRFGNSVTRFLFNRLTGLRITDTQTGLRGYPASMLRWLLTIPGDRFEYELDVLLEAQRQGFDVEEVPIETVYLDDNAGSHFDPVRDSIRVYVPLVRFAVSSLGAFVVDAGLFFALLAATGNLVVAVVGARLVSASFNFWTNRRLVFGAQRKGRSAAFRYAALAAALLGANYLSIRTLLALSMPVVAAKVLTEVGLFLASYKVQQKVVFRGDGQVEAAAERSSVAPGHQVTLPPSEAPVRPPLVDRARPVPAA